MRKPFHFVTLLFTFALVVTGVGSVWAQDNVQTRDRFVISAKAGGINAVTGRARVQTSANSEWEQLTIRDNLEAGDLVRTGVDGRVEMLLNPGSYLRVAENSEFELTNNSLDNLELSLVRGTAIVEVTGPEDLELLINITTPHTKLAIVRRGLYRLKVVPGDVTELIVRKGRVLLSDSATKVKDGRKLIFSGPTFTMAKLNKTDKEMDDFDLWSKNRAETVARANRAFRERDLRLARSLSLSSWRLSAMSLGFWWYSGACNCSTFIPFFPTAYRWGSPYGLSYPRRFYGDRDSRNFPHALPSDGNGTLRDQRGNTGNRGGTAQAPSSPRQSPAPSQPSPRPQPTSRPERSIPRAAEGKVQRLSDPQP